MSSTGSLGLSGAADLPDSIYHWVFEANSGHAWGGWLVANSIAYAPGNVITTAHGRYVITAEDERGVDLSGFGLDDGDVRVEFYRSGDGQFLVTRAGPGVSAGRAGLGSEVDAVWTPGGWVSFGRGGAEQVRLPADVRFTWVFEATSGDRVHGTLTGNSQDFNPGSTIRTAAGIYRITHEVALTPTEAETALSGQVRTTRYWDANLGRDLTLESGGAVATGINGLGSELDRAWNGFAWVPVGRGGSLQADGAYAAYLWRFEANSGDRYEGSMFASSYRHQVGDVITTAHGRYVITSETLHGTRAVVPDGTVYLMRYFDSFSGVWVQGHRVYTEGRPSLGLGLGNEEDFVLGDTLVRVGRGGALQADFQRYSAYLWRFEANSGDRYEGSMFANAGRHEVGDVITTAHGRYVITAETFHGVREVVPDGTVYIMRYFDALSNTWQQGHRVFTEKRPSAGLGLGNEEDFVWDGDRLDPIGRGGALQSDFEGFSAYLWRFEANSGDRYEGSLFANVARHQVGDVITTAHGRYVITSESFHGVREVVPDGTVYIIRYFDAASNGWAQGHRVFTEKRPSAGLGLGNEEDFVWDGDQLDPIGRGGALQSDFEGFSAYLWRFEADSGDRYEGSMFADVMRHQVGDVITTAHGRYVITSETFHGTREVVPDGTVYIMRYFDALSNTWQQGHRVFTERRPSAGLGLGNEEDFVWDGDRLDPIGRGGALQSDFEGFSAYLWRFEANSGDRYEGSLFANVARHQVGDVITTAHGRYVITSESFHGVREVVPDGTVYLIRYFDDASDRWVQGHRVFTEKRPSLGLGLGNEEDFVRNGDTLVPVGRGGAWQADLSPLG
jgi:3-methyladenine DNA glycosylase Tag